ncbi:MAG: TRAP transporter small permease [Dehalococcoidales bacterium]|nr:TRAP transporter small permease [Dehalococcoidales bacterium]
MSLKSKLGKWINNVIFFITSITLLSMMAVVVANVIGRGIFSSPIWGAVEVIGLVGIIMVSFALGYTEREQGHITVSIFVRWLSKRVQYILSLFALILGMGMLVFLIWGGIVQAWEAATRSGSYTVDLHINYIPFKIIWVVGCLIFFGFILCNFLKILSKVKRE